MPAVVKIYIFVSYGHDEFAPQVKALVDSLCQRKSEYEVWWDGKLQESSNYHRQIENQLYELKHYNPHSCFIYVITPYSVDTKRYNYCINEIERALSDKVRILPVRLCNAQAPLQIGCLQWLDMTQCEIDENSPDYQHRLDLLCEKIDSTEPIRFDGKQGSLHNMLNPCQFTLDIAKHLHGYCPRQWLLDATVDWLDNRDENVLLLEGGPGTGKTAFSLWIATRKLPKQIQAWHLCQYNDVNTRSLLTCVKSLTWYLASRLPSFYDSFDDWALLEQMKSGGDEMAAAAFKKLILENLCNVHVGDERIVILIDALDEASEGGTNGLANILAQYSDALPRWLRFIVTTRNDASVTLPLKEMSYRINLDEVTNRENCASDIRNYVKESLDDQLLAENKDLVDEITERSGNVILYAKLMCAAINSDGKVDMSQLPRGLGSYFDSHMSRYFGSNGDYGFDTHALPILHLVLASCQPIKREYIYRRISDTESWCKEGGRSRFNRVLGGFGPLLKEDEEFVLPFHKSFSDWLGSSENKKFHVSWKDGMEKMCEWGMVVISDEWAEEEIAAHFYMFLPQYLIEANRNKDLFDLFSDLSFWKRRRDALAIDRMLQRMFIELALMGVMVRERIFQSAGFREILYFFGDDLFNKGLFVQLKKSGYRVVLRQGMDYKDRMTALRYYYITGDYRTILDNVEFFNGSYEEKELEAQVQNLLGLNAKKCGMIAWSADFYRRAIQISSQPSFSIYYHLNLSRVLTVLCRFEEGREELNAALDDFHKGDWRRGIEEPDMEFVSRQLELAVRYVSLETELFSVSYDSEKCKEEIAWADRLYSSELRRDRYYPRHLQSKILFLLREHRLEEIGALSGLLKESQSMGFDDIRTCYYHSIAQYAAGNGNEGLQTAKAMLENLENNETLCIEKTECLALIDALEGQDHLAEIRDELRPWYFHTIMLVKQMVSE